MTSSRPQNFKGPVFIGCNGFDLRPLGFAEAVLSHHARRQMPDAIRVAVHSVFHGLVHGLQVNFNLNGKRHAIILSARQAGLFISPVPGEGGATFDVLEKSLPALRLLGSIHRTDLDGQPGLELAVPPLTLCDMAAERTLPLSFLMATMASPRDFPFDPDLPPDMIVGMDEDTVASFQNRLAAERGAPGSHAGRQEMVNLVKADFWNACRDRSGKSPVPPR